MVRGGKACNCQQDGRQGSSRQYNQSSTSGFSGNRNFSNKSFGNKNNNPYPCMKKTAGCPCQQLEKTKKQNARYRNLAQKRRGGNNCCPCGFSNNRVEDQNCCSCDEDFDDYQLESCCPCNQIEEIIDEDIYWCNCNEYFDEIDDFPPCCPCSRNQEIEEVKPCCPCEKYKQENNASLSQNRSQFSMQTMQTERSTNDHTATYTQPTSTQPTSTQPTSSQPTYSSQPTSTQRTPTQATTTPPTSTPITANIMMKESEVFETKPKKSEKRKQKCPLAAFYEEKTARCPNAR